VRRFSFPFVLVVGSFNFISGYRIIFPSQTEEKDFWEIRTRASAPGQFSE
jgi:hypothetical protein